MKRITATRKITSGPLAGSEIPWICILPDEAADKYAAQMQAELESKKELLGHYQFNFIYTDLKVEGVE